MVGVVRFRCLVGATGRGSILLISSKGLPGIHSLRRLQDAVLFRQPECEPRPHTHDRYGSASKAGPSAASNAAALRCTLAMAACHKGCAPHQCLCAHVWPQCIDHHLASCYGRWIGRETSVHIEYGTRSDAQLAVCRRVCYLTPGRVPSPKKHSQNSSSSGCSAPSAVLLLWWWLQGRVFSSILRLGPLLRIWATPSFYLRSASRALGHAAMPGMINTADLGRYCV